MRPRSSCFRPWPSPLGELPVLVLAAYRSDGLPRDHLLRRVRHDLRRAGALEEVVLSPLARDETGSLIEAVLGEPAAPSLVDTVHDRTQGLPFFVEELARALTVTGALVAGPDGLEVVEAAEVPLPDTVRDAVLVGVSNLSDEARAAAGAAAVAGESLDLDVVAEISSAAGVGELVESGVLVEDGPAQGSFRHALTREALLADVPWLRRRGLHRRLAEALEEQGRRTARRSRATGSGPATRPGRARRCSTPTRSSAGCTPTATRPGPPARRSSSGPRARTSRGAWRRSESYAHSAEVSGQLAEAARAWREICDLRVGRAGESRWPRRSAAWPPSRTCEATGRPRSRPGGRRPRPSPPTGGRLRPPSSGWRWRTTCGRERTTPRRSS